MASISICHARNLSTTTAKSSSISISRAKSKLRSEHDPDKALQIYSSVANPHTSPLSSRYAQDLTVKRLAKSRRFEEIETLIESHKKDPMITQEPFFSTLIRSYGIAGMFDHALGIYNSMEEFKTPRSTISFNALLTAGVQSKKFNHVAKLFDEIPLKFGFFPDKFSYGILVKSLCDKGSVELAVETLNLIDEKGIEITTVTYTTILDALYKKSKVDEAERIWKLMVKKKCLDATAYNVRLLHYAHDGNPKDINALIGEMVVAGFNPNTITYNYLMDCYCKHGMIKEAMKVYEGLRVNGCKGNAMTFRNLVHHLCRNEKYLEGYKVFKTSVMLHKIPNFGTLKELAEGLVKDKKLKAAKGLIRTVKKNFPDSFMNAWRKLEVELGLGGEDDQSLGGEEKVANA